MQKDLIIYKELFLKTAQENLQNLKDGILKLSQDFRNQEAVEIAYRSAHSLKSEFYAMGYKTTGTLCMIMENIFKKIEEGEIGASKELLDSMQNSLTGLEESLATIDKDNTQPDVTDYIKKLRRITGWEKQ